MLPRFFLENAVFQLQVLHFANCDALVEAPPFTGLVAVLYIRELICCPGRYSVLASRWYQHQLVQPMPGLAMNSPKLIHRIYIKPATDSRTGLPKFGNSGPLYDASHGGELIVWSSHQPFLDACRVLRADGVSGSAEMWDQTHLFPRVRATIEVAAKLTVTDCEGPPRFRSYKNGITALGRRGTGGD